ncbi:alpha-L-arabinofuranosidase C-terminal domain-containing protein [Terriglobus sp. TAA 43]|uniref:alpha-L-arabinofuranosidase C-terminal domain-containing protein n=1 Tax=Terriglobus sp. TAA 43 TaxID=278961 RepID=UPI0006469991|nr:alpha-L-arabinofuranosidase C-terminal domain-containing protein [Terriglobus sp. TAA 43]
MLTRLSAIATAAVLTASLAHAQATLTIQADKPVHPVSPMLYGLMTEEINYSYDGGLYAEMVRNRTFHHDWSGMQHWIVDNAGDSAATIKMVAGDGPSNALLDSMRVDIATATDAAPAGVRNDGWWGMALKPDTTYNGSFYARGDLGSMTISLVNNTTGAVAATATVDGITGDWKQHTFSLHTGRIEAGANNHLLLSFKKPGSVMLQLVSLFPPTYKDRENGNRTDLMEMMAGMHPKFLRMPGGNYLEGDTVEERFDWKATLGPLADRPGHRGPWNYASTDGMGLLEFLEWTEDLNIEPVLAVYAGYSLKGTHIAAGAHMQPFVDDALDEIEFTMGGADTKWGAVRAKLGHPQPFPLHYVEIGNEDNLDRSGSYDERWPQFAKAIHDKYPSLKLIATAPVKRGLQPDLIDDHYYKRAEEFYAMTDHYDHVPRTGPKIFVGEWATREGSPTTDLGAALADAAWMTGMERNSDLIEMSAYAPLFVNVNPGGMQWESDLIGYDAAKSYGSPSYYAQSMFAQYLGTEVSETQLSGGVHTRFFTSVTRDPAKGEIYVKLVNGSTEPQTLDVKVQGATPGAGASLVTLKGDARTATNSIADPKHITPQVSRLRASASIHHTVPPLSVQVMVLPVK